MANVEISRELQILMAAAEMFPGWHFSPTDDQLISFYLKNKLEGSERKVEIIAEIETYKYEPWDLPAQSVIQSNNEWFFFSHRGKKYSKGNQITRTTELGYWKATGKERDIKSRCNVIGTKRTLVFHTGRAPKGGRTDWIMYEYSITDKSHEDFLVVCRLRKNSEFRPHHSSLRDVAQAAESTSKTHRKDVEVAESTSKYNKKDVAEAGESSKDCSSDDIYTDILKDDIINLDAFEPYPTSNFPPMVYYETESARKFQQDQGTANRRIRFAKKKYNSRDERSYAPKVSDSEKMVKKGKFCSFKLSQIWLVDIFSSVRRAARTGIVWFILLAFLCIFWKFLVAQKSCKSLYGR